MSQKRHGHDADDPREPKRQSRDPIADYKEWSEHRYDPGYYTGGRLPPTVRAYQKIFTARDKRMLLVLLIIAGAVMVFGVIWPLFR